MYKVFDIARCFLFFWFFLALYKSVF